MNRKTTVVVVVAAFLIGGGVSAASSSAEPAKVLPAVVKTVPGPERVVTVEGPERVVTKTVTKEVTPAACIEALDIATRVMKAVATEHESFSTAADKGGKDGDVATFLASVTAAIGTMSETVTEVTPDMTVAAAGCRAGN